MVPWLPERVSPEKPVQRYMNGESESLCSGQFQHLIFICNLVIWNKKKKTMSNCCLVLVKWIS